MSKLQNALITLGSCPSYLKCQIVFDTSRVNVCHKYHEKGVEHIFFVIHTWNDMTTKNAKCYWVIFASVIIYETSTNLPRANPHSIVTIQ